MKLYDLEIPVKNSPVLDLGFVPLGLFNRAQLAGAGKPLGLAVERANGEMASIRTRIHEEDIPAPLRGAPIVLISAALMSIAFMGFSGLSF